ncbi:hypothetical protein ACN28G_00325 [Micromonospora sp. WMMA1923]|uniref:hypothetical protein n=1 Tax=Micromonospora sp. WMMA1923 TaxID=3404125 RepID=UPI003B942F4E
MPETHLALKYCGVRIDARTLTDAAGTGTDRPTVAAELRAVLYALTTTEALIAALLPTIDQGLRDVEQVLVAVADDPVPPIDTTGVVQARGPRLDALLGRRAAQIEHLRSVTRLWTAQHPEPDPTVPAHD